MHVAAGLAMSSRVADRALVGSAAVRPSPHRYARCTCHISSRYLDCSRAAAHPGRSTVAAAVFNGPEAARARLLCRRSIYDGE